MTTSHDSNLDISVSLDALAGASNIFRTALLVVPLVGNSLDGARVRTYADADDVADDLTAGFISATTAAQLTSMFSQEDRSNPPSVKCGYIDLVGAETYTSVIPLIRAADDDWYGLLIQDRTGPEAELVSTAIASLRKVFAFQSADADWITTGIPIAYTDVASHNRTIGFYHDTDAVGYAEAGFAAGLRDPDTFSAPWTMNVGGVAAYATDLTTGERGFAIANNMNVLGQFGTSLTWNDPGTNIVGRTMRVIIARDWMHTRSEERIQTLIITKSNQSQPLEVSRAGQAEVGGVVKQVLDEGINIGHFVAGSGDTVTRVTYPAITATDVALRRIRVNANAYYVVDGRLVSVAVNLEAFV